MKTKIEIDTKTFVRFWLVIFGIGLAAFLLYKAQTALLILGISFFLALVLNSPVSALAGRLPGRSRVGATAIAYIAVVAVLGAVITLVVPAVAQQSAKFAQNIPSILEGATSQWGVLNDLVHQYNLEPQVAEATESFKENATQWAGALGAGLVSGIGSIFSFFTMLFLVLVLTFLMLIEGPTWAKRIWGLYSDQGLMRRHRRIANRIHSVVGGYVLGQITVSAIGASFTALAVFVLSLVFPELPSTLALPAAAITFVLSLIPMFGATIGGVIIGLLLALNSFVAAIIYAIYLIIYQQIENNFISPHIQSKRIDLSALMVLGSVTVGLYMFGVVGGIIAIPIAGSIKVLVEEYYTNRREDQRKQRRPAVRLLSKNRPAKKQA